jgi:hypothetical protein
MDNPAFLLWLIREKHADSFVKMLKYFDLFPYGLRTDTQILEKAIKSLIDHDLIVSDINNNFIVSDTFFKVQKGLEFSLIDLAHSNKNRSIICEPFFGRPSNEFICHIFVIMPFNERYDELYYNIIRPACMLDGKYIVKRADDPSCLAGENINVKIYDFIYQAKLIVADISEGNPNVFYELGIAHTLGKNVILINGNRKFRPFDIENIRYIKYSFDSEKQIAELKEKLENNTRIYMGLDE